MRVALFITCFNDTLFPATGRAVVEVLERLGHEVVFPEEQTCCGQMHGNSGYAAEGQRLARRFERVFAGAEVVVSPSASCVGFLREHGAGLDSRLYELSEFLIDVLGVEDVGAVFPHRVTYHPTCHSARLLRVGDRMSGFPEAAARALGDSQLRRNIGKATSTIRAKRAAVVGELDDWETLRDAGAAIKARALATLPEQLERLEAAVAAAGGVVH